MAHQFLVSQYLRENPIPHGNPDHLSMATSDSVFRKPGNVYLIHSTKFTGINKSSRKRYFRWHNDTIAGIKRTKTGLIIGYYMVDDYGNTTAASPWGYLEPMFHGFNEYRKSFQETVFDEFGITSFHDVYPAAKYYNLTAYYNMPIGTTHAFRYMGRGFVESLFGKKNYRKDLLKAVGSTDKLYATFVARQFRNLVPVDWLVSFIRESAESNNAFAETLQGNLLRSILVQIDPRSYRHLLRNVNANHYIISDLTHTLTRPGYAVQPGIYRTWDELHDRNLTGNHVLPVFEDKPIKLLPVAKKLQKNSGGNLAIVPAEHTSIMYEWGQKMHNCIASYRDVALKGAGVYLGIYNGDKLIGNAEIRKNRLIQLLGPCNEPLAITHRVSVENTLKTVGVTVPDTYWGSDVVR